MSGIINSYAFASGGPATVSEPWGEITRQEVVSAGKLTISGLDLSNMIAVQLIMSGITITTDDNEVYLTFIIAGSEATTAYRHAYNKNSAGSSALAGGQNAANTFPTDTTATTALGNGSTKSLSGQMTIFQPASTALHKRYIMRTVYVRPAGTVYQWSNAAGQLDNTGAITGFILKGESNIVAGSLILLGLQ